MINFMDKAVFFTEMAQNMLVNIKMVNKMEMELSPMLTGVHLLVNL